MKAETIIFNANHLTSVKVFDKNRYRHWKWHTPKINRFWFNYEGGWVYITGLVSNVSTDEELLEKIKHEGDFIIENKVLYFRPYVRLSFVNGETYIKTFETLAEAFNWGRDKVKTGINIKFEFTNG